MIRQDAVPTLPNKALQTDKAKLSRLLHSQEPRQLAFAAELGRYVTNSVEGVNLSIDGQNRPI